MKEEKIVHLIEAFNSFQGEGPDVGKSMIILRFKYCSRVHPCPWCDTLIKMRISMEAPYKISDLQKTIYENKLGILISGGEPTFERHFDDTLNLLNELDFVTANVESNGYNLYGLIQQVKNQDKIKYMYSPKIFNEVELEDAKKLTEKFLPIPNVHFKIVYENNPLIIEYLDFLYTYYESLAWQHRVWLMPEGSTREKLIENSHAVFDACEKYNFNFSSRSHIIFGFV